MLGVTARVIEGITGTVTSWRLGSPGASDRFGSGLGTQVGSFAEGVLSTPTTYWVAQPLQLMAMDGAFAGGRVRLAVHLIRLAIPGT